MRKDDKVKKGTKGARRLSVRKETVKDLGVGPGGAREIPDDQLDRVNGGRANIATEPCKGSEPGIGKGYGTCETASNGTGRVFTVACQTLACDRVR